MHTFGKNLCWLLLIFLFSFSPFMCNVGLAENIWSAVAPLDIARSKVGVAIVDNVIYAIGGYNGEYLGIVEAYNPLTNTWITKTSMPTPRSGFVIAAVQKKIHIIGGHTESVHSTGIHEVYDTTTDTWTTENSSPLIGRNGLDANVVNGKIHIISGGTSPFRPWPNTNSNDVYDPETNTWTTKNPIPISVYDYSSLVFDDEIYIIGGRDISANKSYALTQIYNPKTDSWRSGTSLPFVLSGAVGVATSGIAAEKMIYLFNGYVCENNGGTYYSETVYQTQVYEPEQKVWTNNTNILNRTDFGLAVNNDVLYAIGGYNGEDYLRLTEKYVPSNVDVTPTPEPERTSLVIYVAILIITFLVFGISLFVYSKKRKN